jgi:hypothetical protein
MTDGDREPEVSASNAASVERLRAYLDEGERRADERDQVADQRDLIAEGRDQIAAERARIADVREYQLSQARAPRPGEIHRQREEMLKRARQASDRGRARIDRLAAGLTREDADRQRNEADVAYETARSELEADAATPIGRDSQTRA